MEGIDDFNTGKPAEPVGMSAASGAMSLRRADVLPG
jgi:hypothetical protein